MMIETKDVLSTVGALAAGGVGWLWKQVSSKASKDELAAAIRAFDENRAEFKQQLAEHRAEAKESAEQVNKKLDRTLETVGDLAVDIGRLQGKSGSRKR